MSIKPILSVIVPVYNTEVFLPKCLESILNQSYKQLEVIIINDGSSDNSLEVCRKYTEKDTRVKLVSQKNKGLSDAKNIGLKLATAPYVTFIDSDDYLNLSTYEESMNILIKKRVDILCFGIKIVGDGFMDYRDKDIEYYKINFTGKQPVNYNTIFGTNVSVCNKIFKKKLIDKYHINFPKDLWYEDASFYFKYIGIANNIFFITKQYYHYLRHDSSTMAETFKISSKAIDHLLVFKDIFEFYKKNKLLENNKDILHKCFIDFFTLAYDFSPPKQHKKIFKLANEIINYSQLDGKYHPIINKLKLSKFNFKDQKEYSFLEKLFSIKNKREKKIKRKILCILGVKIRIKKNII